MSDTHKPTNANNSSTTINTGPNFDEIELGILEYWKQNKIFEKSLEQTKDGEPYIFYDGPPFATGTPHYGSILPSVIKDAIPRYQTMRGRFVRRRWGWDCHGLPIEAIVEGKLGISGKKQIEEIGVAKFNQACRENVLTYAQEWKKTIDRIARWVDFDNSYKTMDTSYQESVWWALKQIWDKNAIYEDSKVLMYCSRCETPLSNFEVAMDNSYRDVTENSVFVKFKLLPKQRIVDWLTDEQTFALAWTTTPWTLPGNTALNIGPAITYVLVEQNGAKYILAKDRLEVLDVRAVADGGQGQYEILQELSARSLEGLQYEALYPGVISNPNDTAFKIYAEEYVTTEDGTGIVHNAAMYGEVDFESAKHRNLPRQQLLDQKGEFTVDAPEFLQGKFFKDADPVVLQDLEQKSLVYKVLPYTHSYPHCWRCGTPLYYSALPAWFIKIQSLKPELLNNNETINWYPGHLKHGRFQKGIENAPDWNISRNRYWATALPFWKCDNKACDNKVCIGSISELKELAINFNEVYPEYQPDKLEQLDLHKPYIDQVKLHCSVCTEAGKVNQTMSRVPEVVDCWVESGSMPFAELHSPFENEQLFQQRFPSDFVVEYIPQTRAWFYVMHVISTLLFGKSPFQNVMTTGTILAEDGSKMSKSKQNYSDPMEVIQRYGADQMRFYLLASPVIQGEDVNFSERGVSEVGRKLSMILYNVHSFFRMYSPAKVKEDTAPPSSNVLDQWVVSRLHNTHQVVTQALDNYNTPQACRAIQDFVTELSTWFVRRSRDRIKQGGTGAEEALQTLGFVLVETSKLLAPFMPFLAEYLYRDLTTGESVHLEKWSVVVEPNSNLEQEMSQLQGLVETALRLRKEQNMKVRQPLAELQYLGQLDASLEQILADELNVKKVVSVNEFIPRGSWVSAETVSLDFGLTSELKSEGLARELERQIQDLRKKSGLKIGEIVDLYYTTNDEELVSAVKLLDRKKTFVNQVQTSLEVEADFEAQTKIDDKTLWLGLVKL